MWAGIVWVGLVIATVTLVAHDLRLEGGILGESGGIKSPAPCPSPPWCSPSRSTASTPTPIPRAPFTTSSPPSALGGHRILGADADRRRPPVDPQRRLHTTPLSAGDWLLCTALASIVLWADEAKKLRTPPASACRLPPVRVRQPRTAGGYPWTQTERKVRGAVGGQPAGPPGTGDGCRGSGCDPRSAPARRTAFPPAPASRQHARPQEIRAPASADAKVSNHMERCDSGSGCDGSARWVGVRCRCSPGGGSSLCCMLMAPVMPSAPPPFPVLGLFLPFGCPASCRGSRPPR